MKRHIRKLALSLLASLFVFTGCSCSILDEKDTATDSKEVEESEEEEEEEIIKRTTKEYSGTPLNTDPIINDPLDIQMSAFMKVAYGSEVTVRTALEEAGEGTVEEINEAIRALDTVALLQSEVVLTIDGYVDEYLENEIETPLLSDEEDYVEAVDSYLEQLNDFFIVLAHYTKSDTPEEVEERTAEVQTAAEELANGLAHYIENRNQYLISRKFTPEAVRKSYADELGMDVQWKKPED